MAMMLSIVLTVLVVALLGAAEAFIRTATVAARQQHHPLNRRAIDSNRKSLPNSAFDTIQNGRIAVIPEFLPPSEIAVLKRDAASLHTSGLFSTDALASYGTSGQFDPGKDRAVLKLAQWKNSALGDYEVRTRFASRMQDLRSELASGLDRPGLLRGDAVSKYGVGSTEISYTRFGAGAFLKRHVDEHHEELKGVDGWSKPTRRSLSWLVYLNENWKSDQSGGCLRCYERRNPPATNVGARGTGDLQIGWLRASPQTNDPFERPVFLRAQSGQCRMYVDNSSTDESSPVYISKEFPAHPTLFVAGSELLAQKILVTRKDLAERFHFIEPPKSMVSDWFSAATIDSLPQDELIADVPPTGGTLVVFDSVSLPHEVLATVGRDRWATSGWFHEDQQPVRFHTL